MSTCSESTDNAYYLRSRSDKPPSSDLLTVSPTSPLDSSSPIPLQSTNTNSLLKPMHTKRNRKRQFSQIEDLSENEDIDLDINTDRIHKKRKLSRTIKFTLDNKSSPFASKPDTKITATRHKPKRIRLTYKNKPKSTSNVTTVNNIQNDEQILSREASLKPDSPLLNKKKRHFPRIEEFEVPTKWNRRNPYVVCYEFFSGYKIGIVQTLGHAQELKAALKILSQDLVSVRAKASIQTNKNTYLAYIKTRKDKLIGCAIVHVDRLMKRVNIDMFAVDIAWRGNGFASMMVYLIQYRMIHCLGYNLFVCAADAAVPFWSNKKYNFEIAHKSSLEQHELADEKHGHTKHLIWYGSPIQARCKLLQCFVQTQ